MHDPRSYVRPGWSTIKVPITSGLDIESTEPGIYLAAPNKYLDSWPHTIDNNNFRYTIYNERWMNKMSFEGETDYNSSIEDGYANYPASYGVYYYLCVELK